MRKTKSLLIYLLLFSLWSCGPSQHEFETDYLSVKIDEQGQLTSFYDKSGREEYMPEGFTAPVLSIRIDDSIYTPGSMIIDNESHLLKLGFDNGKVTADINFATRSTHMNFELTNIEPVDLVDLVIWGPYPTTINKSIGETVGVVRGETFAMGLQALNPKTLGGYPWHENDCMPQLDIFDSEDPSDLNEEGKRYVLYRVEAAKPDTFGSTLQAYCRNRNKARVAQNWQHDQYLIPPYDDGGVIGSKIALFGCPVDKTLDLIGEIELAENLPHPEISGIWGKQSKEASAAYLILAFGEDDIDKAIDYTKKAGLKYLYHPGPFDTWGHFQFNYQFPNGAEGLKACVDRAAKEGLHVGVHFLSNFITTNDAYVTPVPDNRLAKVGSSISTMDMNKTQKDVPIETPDIFRQMQNNNLKTVVIDDELITYTKVSDNAPYFLLDCTRGAFGTKASGHKSGSEVSLLADHGYNVFLGDAELSKEMAVNIAGLYNQCGLRQISFDGLEGNRSTGMGNYGEILMTTTWFNHLDDDIKKHFIADASRTSHYFWHIYTRMNWGEPWYAGFRESQTDYRFKNQAYFQRNLMPGMLGWFLLTKETSLEDIEWMLAKSVAYNAGYGFVCNYKSLEENGLTDQILDLIGLWEKVRMDQVFNNETKEILKDPMFEFHIEQSGDKQSELYEFSVQRYEYATQQRQPGELKWSVFKFNNPYDSQALQFVITVPKTLVFENPVLEIDNTNTIEIPIKLEHGYILKYSGGEQLTVFDREWNILSTQPVANTSLMLDQGRHSIKMKGEVVGKNPQPVKIELKTKRRISYF